MLAGTVQPFSPTDLKCPGGLSEDHIATLLSSPERTQRFAGVKLARLRNDVTFKEAIEWLRFHPDEDIYVRLEAAAYLTRICGDAADRQFAKFLYDSDPQIRLETVVALAATATAGSIRLLDEILCERNEDYYLRSAAAWALGQIGNDAASKSLIAAFGDTERAVREEALEALESLSSRPYKHLTDALLSGDDDSAAGAAETLRRYATLPGTELARILSEAEKGDRAWVIWLLSNLPSGEASIDTAIAQLQTINPRVHFAVTVLWTFLRSWIAPSWELNPRPEPIK